MPQSLSRFNTYVCNVAKVSIKFVLVISALAVIEINFYAGSKDLVQKVVAKLKHLGANIGGHLTASYPRSQFYDQTQFHMVKGINNAFDHMEMCFVL